MGLGGAASCFLGGRPRGTAAVCALALAMTLAQLVASWAWASGAHVTVEQVTLHEEGVAHGHAYHHGSLAHGHGYHHANYQASPETLGPVLAPASDHSGLYQDVLHARPVAWARSEPSRVPVL